MKSESCPACGPEARGAPVKANRDLRQKFLDALERVPGGEQINSCIQCGTCSGSCPVSWAMDYTPRQIIGLFRVGEMDTVLRSNTIWICSSCYQCAARCPADIKITDLMYAFKRLAMDQQMFPARFSGYVFSEAFVEQVRKYGRNYEAGLIGKFFLRTSLSEMVRRAPSGFRLWRKGRMAVRPEKIKGIKTLRKIIRRAEEMEAVQEPVTVRKTTDAVGYEAI